MQQGLSAAGRLQPGHGTLSLTGTVAPTKLFADLEYLHRIDTSFSAFAKGWAGASRLGGGVWQPDYGIGAGLRLDW